MNAEGFYVRLRISRMARIDVVLSLILRDVTSERSLQNASVPGLLFDNLNAVEGGGGAFAGQHAVTGLAVSGVNQTIGETGVGLRKPFCSQNGSSGL